MDESAVRVALVGNPNVGKSTLFNSLTGMRQHTGNWPGKTVEVAEGIHEALGREFHITDLPGCYSLNPRSAEETVTRDHLISGMTDVAVAVCDATVLERNLILALQVIRLFPRTVVVLNLMDEAKRHGITVDRDRLEAELGVPVVCTAAGSGKGLSDVPKAILRAMEMPIVEEGCIDVGDSDGIVAEAERISGITVSQSGAEWHSGAQARVDRILTGRFTGFAALILLVCGIMWLTVEGANVPSGLLSGLFADFGVILRGWLTAVGLPAAAVSCLMDGVYLVTTWVVSVMLPPMAIFFPLFTLLEDLGYLPRVAFLLDRLFKGAGSCGKQALTMCMGLGCNAAGVVGCRIIDSPRERRIAILTNALVPCNGRFPGILCICTVFFAATGFGAAVGLTAVIGIGVIGTLAVSRVLSGTLLRGTPSSFALELPPYRVPRVGQVIVRSVFDRTLFVLGRAVSVAAPAGLVIWLFSHIRVGDATLLQTMASTLDPVGRVLGMDGVILTAFILGLPANEIVLPLAAMCYTASGVLADVGTAEMGTLLYACGWDQWTAAAVILFSLMHWPCSTTLITVRRETGSVGMMVLAAVIPTVCGVVGCLMLQLMRVIVG